MSRTRFVQTTVGEAPLVSRQRQLEREELVADRSRERLAAPIDYDPRGAISWTQGLAKMLDGYMAGRAQRRATGTAEQLAEMLRTREDQQRAAAETYLAEVAPVPAGSDAQANMTPRRERTPADMGAALGRLLLATGGPGEFAAAERDRLQRHSAETFGGAAEFIAPDGRKVVGQVGNRGTFRPLQGYAMAPSIGNYNPGDYTPDSFARFQQTGNSADLRRSWAPALSTVGGVSTMVERATGAGGGARQQPLSSLGAEAAAAATIKAAEAGAGATAKAQAERAVDAQASVGTAVSNAEQMVGVIDRLASHPGMSYAVGKSSVLPIVPGTDAADFRALLEQAQGRTFLEGFQSLKGGGAITEVEGKKADQAIARLQTSQSEEGFREALRDLRDVVLAGRARAETAAQRGAQTSEQYLNRTTPSVPLGTAAPAGPPAGPPRISSDAEYDALPPGTQYVGPDGRLRRKAR